MVYQTITTMQPAKLVDMNAPGAVLEEVKYNFIHSYPIQEFDLIREVYRDFRALYEGDYPGERGWRYGFTDPGGRRLHHDRRICGRKRP